MYRASPAKNTSFPCSSFSVVVVVGGGGDGGGGGAGCGGGCDGVRLLICPSACSPVLRLQHVFTT